MIELYRSPWRHHFERALDDVRSELIIASPFIKKSEAEYVCGRLLSHGSSIKPHVRVITDLRTESVLGGSLDMEALKTFRDLMDGSEIFTLPHLHAKVYIFDGSFAVIGSANLTRSGLDSNYEYGVGIHDLALVYRIKADMDSYARIGNVLGRQQIDELSEVASDLSAQYRTVQRSATSSAKKQFDDVLKGANLKFIEAYVGTRSAHSLFSEAILYVLSQEPLSTQQIHPRVKQLLPDLCDDTEELVISGQRFGKAWKHDIRNAQQSLKKQNRIRFDGKVWHTMLGTE